MTIYFSDREKGGFPIALLNLLSELGDDQTREKAAQHYNSRENPLITTNDRVHHHVCTRLVADLTEGTYQGILRFGGLHNINLEESLGELYGERIEFPLQVAQAEEAAGRIKQDQEIIAYKGPALVLIHAQKGNTLKWILDTDKGYFVDSGYVQRYTLEDLALIGIMLVQNKENPLKNNYFCDREGRKLEL